MTLLRAKFIPVLLVAIYFARVASAAVTPADWTSSTTATLGSSTITMSGVTFNDIAVDLYPFGTGAFASVPLPPNTEFLQYSSADNWTATFSPPISRLALYINVWRGSQTSSADPPAVYSFSQSFDVVTGLQDVTHAANQLIMPDTGGDFGFHSGIIVFPGVISSLNVVRTGQAAGNLQALTFAVPEPSTLALVAIGCAAIGWRRR